MIRADPIPPACMNRGKKHRGKMRGRRRPHTSFPDLVRGIGLPLDLADYSTTTMRTVSFIPLPSSWTMYVPAGQPSVSMEMER